MYLQLDYLSIRGDWLVEQGKELSDVASRYYLCFAILDFALNLAELLDEKLRRPSGLKIVLKPADNDWFALRPHP